MITHKSVQDSYNELSIYTLERGDSAFIHQLVVDAFAAQNADEKTKPITLAFALIGLYLHNEKQYSGRKVQNVHMRLGKDKKKFPTFIFPDYRGDITVADVLKSKPGPGRDHLIEKWSRSVWNAWSGNRQAIADFLQAELHL